MIQTLFPSVRNGATDLFLKYSLAVGLKVSLFEFNWKILTERIGVNKHVPSLTWIEVCEGADDKVQRGDCQHGQQQQLESDDPLHTCQVDSKQSQEHSS